MKKYILITDIIGLVGSLIIFILSIIREYYLWAIVILGIICLIWVFKLIYYYKNYGLHQQLVTFYIQFYHITLNIFLKRNF